MYLFNSLSRKKEEFIPLNKNEVGMYVCGMTVYDYCHIGHARVMVVFDTLARHFRNSGFKLKFVRNITDIDDKIIKRAAENGEDISALTQRFTQAMHEDEAALLCQKPDIEPKATEHIEEIIKIIESLIQKGYAYPAPNGDIYYAVRKFADYGKLANRNLDDLRAGERVAINEDKNDPLDFVLWKASKPNEPFWDSPFGRGRPGWHIECSAMGATELGEHFDIHGGGMDLKFPHHECEIAQSEAAFGHKFVNYWLHNGFVNIDNEKMSKSLNNFFTVREVLEQFKGEVIRFFILQTHYRSPLNYSNAGLEEAEKNLTRLYKVLAEVKDFGGEVLTEEKERFLEAMDNDLNTPLAIAVIFDLAKRLSQNPEPNLALTLKTLAGYLGLLQENPEEFLKAIENKKSQNSQISEAEILEKIAERNEAKKNKNYALADEIRKNLENLGVLLKDNKEGTTWQWK